MREEVLKRIKNAVSCITQLTELHQTRSTYRRCRLSGTAFLRAPKLYGNHWMKLQKNAILNPSNPYVIVLVLTTTGLLFTGLTESFLLGKGVQYDQFRIRVK